MLPCLTCAYRRPIVGDTHSRCVFDWTKTELPVPQNTSTSPRTQQWFIFPLNFDPVWGPNECPARADTADETKIRTSSPMEDVMSLLGKRGGFTL